MVEPAFLVVGAIVFCLILVVILKSGGGSDKPERSKGPRSKKGGKKGAAAPKSAKKGNKAGPGKKTSPAAGSSEIFTVGEARSKEEDRQMLDFLRGRDANLLAKQARKEQKQKQKKKKKIQEEEEEEDFGETVRSSDEDNTDFVVIKKKVQKKKEGEQEEKKQKKKKKFFKDEPEEQKPEGKNRRQQRRVEQQAQAPTAEEKEKPLRSEGEDRERKEGKGEERERRYPPRKPLPAPTGNLNIAPDVGRILDMITAEEMTKSRYHSKFSQLERRTVLAILSLLNASDLVALSRVNRYFNKICKTDSLWEVLVRRDFGVQSLGKYRTWRAAYKVEFKKRHAPKEPKEEKKRDTSEE